MSCFEVLGEAHDARRLPVEPMHDVNAPARLLPEIVVEQCLCGIFLLARCRDREQSVRLDDDHDVVVLMQQRQRRRQRHRFRARQDRHVVAGCERAFRIDLGLAVHADAAGLQHLAQRRSR